MSAACSFACCSYSGNFMLQVARTRAATARRRGPMKKNTSKTSMRTEIMATDGGEVETIAFIFATISWLWLGRILLFLAFLVENGHAFRESTRGVGKMALQSKSSVTVTRKVPQNWSGSIQFGSLFTWHEPILQCLCTLVHTPNCFTPNNSRLGWQH